MFCLQAFLVLCVLPLVFWVITRFLRIEKKRQSFKIVQLAQFLKTFLQNKI